MSASRVTISRLSTRSSSLRRNATTSSSPISSLIKSSSSDSAKRFSTTSRLPMVLRSLGLSMMPLHSAIASARLRSILAVESQSWGLIPQVSPPLTTNVLPPLTTNVASLDHWCRLLRPPVPVAASLNHRQENRKIKPTKLHKPHVESKTSFRKVAVLHALKSLQVSLVQQGMLPTDTNNNKITVTLFMNLYTASLNYISSTSQSAMINLLPAFTYVLSIASRQEQAELNQLRGVGKLLGTIASVSGAFTLILCHRKSVTSMIFASDFTQDIVGYAMIVFGTLSFSAWIVLQKPMMERYPAGLSITAIMYLFGTLQTCLIAIFTSHEASKWKLNWDLELLNIVTGGILNGGVAMFIFTWCAKKRGPLFVAVFSPLNLLFTAVIEMVILGTTMNFGGMLGSVMIVGGLYMFLWSKAKEETKDAEEADEILSPFLPQSTETRTQNLV
ncbi:hypothetical protein Scep_010993 [Stephania cephalantha]|uniref:EamA domain-containing protein n=1 Tax=Stephania cephalantha TaxID=152367 RepID=A0AAP0JW86_9MAGN